MEKYSLEKKVPSCYVDKKLIEQLERYIKGRLTDSVQGILRLDPEFRSDLDLKIKDKTGEESLSSIDEYHREKFSDDIKELSLHYSIEYTDLSLRMRFSKTHMFSDLSIDLKCNGAREIALGISNELINIIKENKTIHFIFYQKYAWIVYFFWMLTTNLFSWLEFTYSDQLWLFFLLLGVAFFLGRLISPYSTFDTTRRESQDKIVSWFLNGMAAVFLFGVAAIYLRKLLIL